MTGPAVVAPPVSRPAALDVAFLDALIELIPDAAVAADEQGRIRAANRLAAELFGCETSELVGEGLDLLVPERLREVHHTQHRRYVESPRVRQMGVGLDLRGRRRDATEFPVDISLAPVATDEGTLVVATIRDLTERRREQAAEAHLAAIVESTTDAIAATDLDGNVTSWNPGAERLLGYRAAEILGRPIYVVVADEFRESLARARQHVLAGGTVEPFESRRLRKDGSLVDAEVTLSAIHDRHGTLLGVSGVFRDITERRRAEADRARAQREHEELRMLADRERIARDLHDLVIQRVFVAGMSLHAASGLVDRDVAQRLHRVVDELDTVTSEIRSTIFELEQHRQATTSFRARVLQLTGDAAHALGHDPVVRFTGPLDNAVPDDVAEQALAVLREALANVARHAHATATSVELVVDRELAVRVTDNGVGIGTPRRSSGLRNLRDRAEALDGCFRLAPGDRGGTRLEWRVPLPAPDPSSLRPETARSDAIETAVASASVMETVLEATVRLRAVGYDADFSSTEDGSLRCGACGIDHDPSTMTIDEVVRYEGVSDPDDEAILLALRCDCGRHGLYVAGFGPSASAADVAVLAHLR